MFKRLFFYSVAAFVCSIFTAVLLFDANYVEIRTQEEQQIIDGIYTLVVKQADDAPLNEELINHWSGQFGYELSIKSVQQFNGATSNLAQLLATKRSIELVSGWTQDRVTAYFVHGEQILQMTKMATDRQAYLLYWYSLLVTIFTVLAVFVFGYVNTHKKYIKKLVQAYEAYGHGNLSARVATDMPSPYSQLASRFNTMAAKIESLLEEHQHMLNGVSHDLKTPLARLRFALDMTRNYQSTEEYQSAVQFMDEDLDALEDLLDDWFLYVGLNATHTAPKLQVCCLQSILSKVVSRTVKVHPHIQALSERPSELVIAADKKLLTRAIENLVNNACKFAKSTIRVSTYSKDGYVSVEVEDDGPGIPKEKHEDVLKPFHRLDSSRHIAGIGLGLSIVTNILHSHKGKLAISASSLGGAKFTFMLPEVNTEVSPR